MAISLDMQGSPTAPLWGPQQQPAEATFSEGLGPISEGCSYKFLSLNNSSSFPRVYQPKGLCRVSTSSHFSCVLSTVKIPHP